jgi:hypothetical protein
MRTISSRRRPSHQGCTVLHRGLDHAFKQVPEDSSRARSFSSPAILGSRPAFRHRYSFLFERLSTTNTQYPDPSPESTQSIHKARKDADRRRGKNLRDTKEVYLSHRFATRRMRVVGRPAGESLCAYVRYAAGEVCLQRHWMLM